MKVPRRGRFFSSRADFASRPRNCPSLPQRFRSSFPTSAHAKAAMTRSLFLAPQIGWLSFVLGSSSLVERILLLVPCHASPPFSGSLLNPFHKAARQDPQLHKTWRFLWTYPYWSIITNGSTCSRCCTILSTRLHARIFSFTKSGDSFGYSPLNSNVEVTQTGLRVPEGIC